MKHILERRMRETLSKLYRSISETKTRWAYTLGD